MMNGDGTFHLNVHFLQLIVLQSATWCLEVRVDVLELTTEISYDIAQGQER
jgi:hypothetical protein